MQQLLKAIPASCNITQRVLLRLQSEDFSKVTKPSRGGKIAHGELMKGHDCSHVPSLNPPRVVFGNETFGAASTPKTPPLGHTTNAKASPAIKCNKTFSLCFISPASLSSAHAIARMLIQFINNLLLDDKRIIISKPQHET
jgi:hypothetical protein